MEISYQKGLGSYEDGTLDTLIIIIQHFHIDFRSTY